MIDYINSDNSINDFIESANLISKPMMYVKNHITLFIHI